MMLQLVVIAGSKDVRWVRRDMNPYDATASFSWSGANVGVDLAAGYFGVYGRAISYY
ncbi:MAG: hypothetical protein AAFN74_11375 [Myxococcota bacterium]